MHLMPLNLNRVTPYLVFIMANIAIYLVYGHMDEGTVKETTLGVLSNGIFFFIAFIFFDLIRASNYKKEAKYLNDYIKNKISNDVFVSLYFQKKIIHGYNLETNTVENIMSIINYSEEEIRNSIKHQRYLGFQLFKNSDEVRLLFEEALNNNLLLKYSSHIETINLLKITNNLSALETIFKNEKSFKQAYSQSTEFVAVKGKDMNADNPDGYMLLRKTSKDRMYVVYDSGVFEGRHEEMLVDEYVLSTDTTYQVAKLIHQTLHLMKAWLPEITRLRSNEKRFRIIKDYFSPNTQLEFGDAELYVADIIKRK